MPEGLPQTEVELLRAFEDHLALERRLSLHTVAAYRSDLEQLATFLTRNRSSLGDAPYPLLRRFLAQQHTLGYARATIARRVGAIKTFYRWAVSTGRIEADTREHADDPHDHREPHQPVRRGRASSPDTGL